MVRKSWNVPHLAERNKGGDVKTSAHRFWGSARMTYTICAFLAMVVHICLRNTMNIVILCMVKPLAEGAVIGAGVPGRSCDGTQPPAASANQRTGDLMWTRAQEFTLQGAFYYGYIAALPFAGRIVDRVGGKPLFVFSLILQAIVFISLPFFARLSYAATIAMLVLQGLFAGSGNPAIYQLFAVWAHPMERTALMSFAYGGYAVGAMVAFPVSSSLCGFGWEVVFYVIGSVALMYGISCQWLIYSKLDDHPRLSRAEYDYLKLNNTEPVVKNVPWKAMSRSTPVYAFILTHVFHTYGMIVFTLMLPRFFKEAIGLSFKEVGIAASSPFLGCFASKLISILSCSYITKTTKLGHTNIRKITYAVCSIITIVCICGIIVSDCSQKAFILLLSILIGATTDLGFSAVYWPSLLFFAPSYCGLLSGIANCLANVCGFLAPAAITSIVQHGTKSEWNLILVTLVVFYLLGGVIFVAFSSTKLQHWDARSKACGRQEETKV